MELLINGILILFKQSREDEETLCCFKSSYRDDIDGREFEQDKNTLTPSNSKISRKSRKTRNNESKEYMRSELKALKVLGIVFICFIIAWLPFCLINYALVFYEGDQHNQLAEFLNYFTYIGYISSTFNPIIYTAFNKRFRQNFFEILTGKKKIPTGKKKTKRKPVISIRI